MKIKYIIPSVIACMATVLTGCTDNTWNEHYVDGFQPGDTYSSVVTVSYDLTKSDYEAIGNGLYNKDNPQEEKDAANAIKNNLYFDQQSCYPMEYAVAWFLDQENTNFQVYDVGSKVQVGLTLAFGAPEQLTKVAAAKRIVFSEALATSNIPSLLKQNYPDAEAGQYAIVSYPGATAASSQNAARKASVRKASTRADIALTSNIKNLSEGANLTATAVVTAQSTRGLILTDNAGSIFYYNNNVDLDTYKIGTVVNVSGKVEVYGGFQLTSTATLSVAGFETYTYPTPATYTADMIEAAIKANTPNTAQYITYEGTLSISNTYYNINIPGVTSGQGSLYTPTDALKAKLVDGTTYKFTGYYTGITSSKYFYMVLTDAVASDGGNTGGGNTGGDNTGGDNTGGSTGGTGVSYWSVAEALSQLDEGFTGDATVGGYITSITGVSTSYGNADYIISDDKDGSNSLVVFRGYYLDGVKFTSEDQLQTGKFVVVQGDLIIYTDGTKEFTSGSKILSITDEPPTQGSGGSGGSTTDSIDEATAVNVVYLYDGSTWSIPVQNDDEDQLPVVTVDPSAYSQMGLSINNLTDPAYYLPTYMKLKYPYINTETELLVAYNIKSTGCATSILIYDGSKWTVNNNYLQNRIAEFAKTTEGYQFRKYIGEETYFPFIGEEIQMNAGYLLVADGYNYCAGPVTPTSGYYGYMYPQDIEFNEEDGSVTLSNSDFTYTFLNKIDINGVTYETPEGKFLIQGADGNLVYLSGPTYYNFGIQSEPYYSTSNGVFKDSYLWGAKKNDDGTWMIYCDYEYNNEMYHKVIYYADGYQNFANYTDDQLTTHPEAVMIKLYISEDFMNVGGSNSGDETE